jgi:hypothetical protein
MATRAMALGYFKDMPLRQLTELLVELDDFYQHDVILFDRYDEDVYNYIKAGITTRTSMASVLWMETTARPRAGTNFSISSQAGK